MSDEPHDGPGDGFYHETMALRDFVRAHGKGQEVAYPEFNTRPEDCLQNSVPLCWPGYMVAADVPAGTLSVTDVAALQRRGWWVVSLSEAAVRRGDGAKLLDVLLMRIASLMNAETVAAMAGRLAVLEPGVN